MDAITKVRGDRRVGRGSGEVVVITGASAGVGRATARAFARRGARIGLIARDSDALSAACDDVHALGGKAVMCVGDVARPAEVETAAAMIEERLGPIEIWVNNAMVTVSDPSRLPTTTCAWTFGASPSSATSPTSDSTSTCSRTGIFS